MKLDLNCQEVSRLMSDGQDAALAPADRARFRLHLVLCATCRDVQEQMNFLRRAMRTLHQENPDDLGGQPGKDLP
jgi:predicted anti-sigma-YlaC factor YlaD